MKNRPSKSARAARQVPLDHLRPGGRHPSEPTGEPTASVGGSGAQPAEPNTPGAGDGDATRGKATRTPAEIATRPHLEGSEQNPA